MIKPDGGAAFPRVGKVDSDSTYPHEVAQQGMSLRDYHAGKALVGLLGAMNTATTEPGWGEKIAKCSYQLADLMIEARKK